MTTSDGSTICVGAGVAPGLPFARETMHALPDPADPSQAVLQNIPFFVDDLNFGDIVRVGEPDQAGIHPIRAVVEASGHTRFVVFVDDQPTDGLVEWMGSRFHPLAVRMETGFEDMVSVSMHPDVDPDEVAEALMGWIAGCAADDEGLWTIPGYSIGEPIETVVGPLRTHTSWTRLGHE